MHVKDPVYVAPTAAGGVGCLVVCIHSFAWAEGHSGHVRIRLDADGGVVTTGPVVTSTFPRGTTWDVATARITGSVPAAVLARLTTIDSSGGGAGDGTATVFLYDGAESFREQPQNARAKARPRGYCCEELGGALVGHLDGPLARLSPYLPLMVRVRCEAGGRAGGRGRVGGQARWEGACGRAGARERARCSQRCMPGMPDHAGLAARDGLLAVPLDLRASERGDRDLAAELVNRRTAARLAPCAASLCTLNDRYISFLRLMLRDDGRVDMRMRMFTDMQS